MTEIQIIMPLSVLEGAESLTPEGITEFLQAAIENKTIADTANQRATQWRQTLIGWANRLEEILDIDSEFQKFTALRDFAEATKQTAQGIERTFK